MALDACGPPHPAKRQGVGQSGQSGRCESVRAWQRCRDVTCGCSIRRRGIAGTYHGQHFGSLGAGFLLQLEQALARLLGGCGTGTVDRRLSRTRSIEYHEEGRGRLHQPLHHLAEHVSQWTDVVLEYKGQSSVSSRKHPFVQQDTDIDSQHLIRTNNVQGQQLGCAPKGLQKARPAHGGLAPRARCETGRKRRQMGCVHGWGCNFRRRALNMCVGVHFAGDTMTRLGTRWGGPAAPGNARSRRRRAPWSPMRTRFCLSFLSRKWLAISARHGRGASFHNPCLNRSLQLFAVSVPYRDPYRYHGSANTCRSCVALCP